MTTLLIVVLCRVDRGRGGRAFARGVRRGRGRGQRVRAKEDA